jgi:hypothetical protein
LALKSRAAKGLAVLFALSALIPLAALHPAPVQAAGGSCTGWESKRIPPDTIRVFRKWTGVVEVVPFQTYVVTVMGKEWPGYLPVPLIEAGAVAVKQYAWYYAMEGRHRSSYVTAKGECYDVRDTTTDQLYKPEKARIVQKHWAAMEATWEYSLRKNGRQFLTGYRTGNKGECASDATGWKLMARTATRCVEDLGYNWRQILHAYYGPEMDIINQDGTIVDGQGVAIGDSGVLGSTMVAGAGPKTFDERHEAIDWNGTWQRTQSDTAFKKTLTYTSNRSATVEFRVAGRSLALVGRVGPKNGRLRVFIEGELAETVNLYAPNKKPQQVIFSRVWDADRVRSVRLELDGPAERPRIDLDAIILER